MHCFLEDHGLCLSVYSHLYDYKVPLLETPLIISAKLFLHPGEEKDNSNSGKPMDCAYMAAFTTPADEGSFSFASIKTSELFQIEECEISSTI